jgi:PAS domain S-box-containing protein
MMQLIKNNKTVTSESTARTFSTAIIENSPDCLKILDAEGRLEFMNTAGQCLMEIEDFDLVRGQCWWDLWGDEEKEIVRSAFQQSLKGVSQQFIAKCATPKGKYKWWDVLISPVTVDENGVAQVISISRDITERKEQEDTVRKMASHLKLATESANVGTWCLDIPSLTLDWSPLHKRMWGYDENRADLLYEDWHRIILPEDKEKTFQKVEEARVNHSFYEVEYRIARANDQSIRWIRSSGLYYYAANGEALTLTGVSMDITREKEAEQALAYRKALLEAQNEAVPDGFLIVDTKGNMLSYNKKFATIWGIPDHITKQKDDTAALQVAMTKIKDPQAFIEKVNYYYAHPAEKAWDELQFLDGRIIERHGNQVVDENGIVYGWAWYFRDITQRKKAEEEIKESEQRFRHLADNAPMWVWMADEKVYVSYANKEILNYIGLQHYSELTAHSWEAFVHPADIPAVYTSLGQANNQPVSFEFRVKNGATGEYE